MNRWSVVFLVAATACGGGADPAAACQDYLTAAFDCFDEAYAGDKTSLDAARGALDGYCAAYDDLSGSAASDAADLLNCQADVYAGGDCSDPKGLTALSTDVATCATL